MKTFSQQTVFGGAVINMSSRTLGRILRFVLLMLITLRFGASHETDAFFIAQSVCFSFLLLGEGLFNFSFLPVFVDRRKQKGEAEAWELAKSTFTYVNGFLIVVTLVVFLFASPIASMLAPGFSENARSLTAALIRVTSPVPLLVGLSAIIAVIFYSYRSYLLPASTALFESLGPILAIILVADAFGIASIAWGLVFGVGLRALTLLYAVKKKKPDFGLSWKIKESGVAKVGNLSWPRFLGISLNNLNLVIDRLLASGLGVGYVSCLTCAYRLFEAPSAILIATFGRTLMPVFAESASGGSTGELRRFVSISIRTIGFIIIPFATALFLLRVPLVDALFRRGAFTSDDAQLTSTVFLFYDIGLASLCFNLILSGVFYALQDAMTPLKIGLVNAVLNIAADLVLIRLMGLAGIALSTSLIALLNSVLLFFLLKKRIGNLYAGAIMMSLSKIALASLLMGVAVWFFQANFDPVPVLNNRFLRLGLLLFAAMVTYLVACVVLRVRECRYVMGIVKHGFSR